MDFSVIVCTYNRARNLPACLGRLEVQDTPEGLGWEVLVVDNNSTDDTHEVVAALSRRGPVPVRYCFEAAQGLNNARNRGIKESTSRFFAFIDDDILVAPGWLRAIARALADNDADAVGGRIYLQDHANLPGWVRANPEMLGFLGFRDLGDEPLWMDGKSSAPFGGNMAFHRRVVERVGLFDPRYGRKGSGEERGGLFKGAETEYFYRLGEAGARMLYAPDAVVYHRVEAFQLRKRYFRTIHYNAGMQKALYDERQYGRTLGGVPLFLFPQLVRAAWKYGAQTVTRGPAFAFRQQMTVGHFLGMMTGYARRSREAAAHRAPE